MEYFELAKDILMALIPIDTSNPPGNELTLAYKIEEILLEFGYKSHITEIDHNRANIFCNILQDTDGEKLLFQAHMDVVPASNDWNAFSPHMDCDKLFGRGSCDTKASIACMIAAALKFHNHYPNTKGTLSLLFVADEEVDNLGAKAFLAERPNFDFAVIGEPTQLQVAIAHRGVARFKITAFGKSCHSGTPEQGINAIYLMMGILEIIKDLNAEFSLLEHPVLPPPSIVPTMINGGIKPNIIPGSCEIIIDIRTHPNQTKEKLLSELIDRIKKENIKYKIEESTILPAGAINSDDQYVNLALDVSKELLGNREPIYFSAGCEQSLFLNEGIKAIVLGPGRLQEAHTVNEYVELSQISKGVDFYFELAKKILVSSGK